MKRVALMNKQELCYESELMLRLGSCSKRSKSFVGEENEANGR